MPHLTNLFLIVGILALAVLVIFIIYSLIWFAAYLWDRWRFRKEPVEDWSAKWDKASAELVLGHVRAA